MKASTYIKKFSLAIRYARNNGLKAFFNLLVSKMKLSKILFLKTSITKPYEHLFGDPIGNKVDISNVHLKSINWFIPPVGKGSGGHLNIFRFMKMLEDIGYVNRIIIVGQPMPSSINVVKNQINKWFFQLTADVYFGESVSVPPAYFAMATSWSTAYTVRRFQSCIEKCYFVQDYEPWFYAAGTDSLLAEETYRFGFWGITAGSWLAEKLHNEFAMNTLGLGFSYDKKLYRPKLLKRNDSLRRIFFYARPPTARRAFELGILVLEKVCRILPNIQVVLAGWDLSEYEIPFPNESVGLVDIDELPEIYAKCDLALVLSCTNLSLLPLELMACGVPVVSNRGPHTQWLLNDENSMLCDSTISGLADAVMQLLNRPELREKLVENALEFANKTSWEHEAKVFSNYLTEIKSLKVNDGRALQT